MSYMTVEQVANELGLTKSGVYAATFRGRFTPRKIGRRTMIPREQVDAYKVLLQNRWASKIEAQELLKLHATKPAEVLPRHWDMFVSYAGDADATYEDVGIEFHVQRQRAFQIIQGVIDVLVGLDVDESE